MLIKDEVILKEYVLNALKNPNSRMKKFTVRADNSNHYISYFVISEKAEAVESGNVFAGIDGHKVIFK
jgi:hypothetical protein